MQRAPSDSSRWSDVPAFSDLSQLIAFPTVSTESNVECSQWVQQRLESLGFETEWLSYIDPNGIEKACVAGRLNPTAPEGSHEHSGLAYFCHNDVVPVESWSFAKSGPWEACVHEGRVYGRGSCDMKGSLACFLAAIEQASDDLVRPLYVFCTADEEIGFHGAQQLVDHSTLYREVATDKLPSIIGEPTELQVVHAHKGGCMMQFTAKGRAAHSSTTEGINANFLMIPFLSDLKELAEQFEANPAYQDARFDPPGITLNLILNDHTPAVNITPAQSVASLYFRTMPDIDSEGIRQQLIDLAEQHGIEYQPLGGGQPVFTDPNSPFVQQVLKIANSKTSQTVSYGTDGGCFSELTRMVIFGPGNIQQAHTDDEFISVEQLEKGIERFAQVIQHYCCSQ